MPFSTAPEEGVKITSTARISQTAHQHGDGQDHFEASGSEEKLPAGPGLRQGRADIGQRGQGARHGVIKTSPVAARRMMVIARMTRKDEMNSTTARLHFSSTGRSPVAHRKYSVVIDEAAQAVASSSNRIRKRYALIAARGRARAGRP